LAQELPNAGLRAAMTSTVLPQMFSGTFTGTWTLFPDATPGESEAVAVVFESAKAGLAYRDMMPVAAAARTTPLLRFCRTLVVFLLGEVRKPTLGSARRSKAGLGTAGGG
jgi:hypothetical protein